MREFLGFLFLCFKILTFFAYVNGLALVVMAAFGRASWHEAMYGVAIMFALHFIHDRIVLWSRTGSPFWSFSKPAYAE